MGDSPDGQNADVDDQVAERPSVQQLVGIFACRADQLRLQQVQNPLDVLLLEAADIARVQNDQVEQRQVVLVARG